MAETKRRRRRISGRELLRRHEQRKRELELSAEDRREAHRAEFAQALRRFERPRHKLVVAPGVPEPRVNRLVYHWPPVDHHNVYRVYYNSASTTAATTMSANSDVVWDTWSSSLSNAITTYEYKLKIWDSWNNSGTGSYFSVQPVRQPMTTEEIVAEAARVEQNRVVREAARVKREEERQFANERAEKLLLEHLDEAQRTEWVAKQQIHVVSQSGRRYCIKHGRQHNIFHVDRFGRRLLELCGHVADDVPNADNVLAQKLALELMEADFLRTCNIWDLRGQRRCVSHEGSPFAGV